MMFKITFLAAMIFCWFPTASKAQLAPMNKVVACGESSVVLNAIKVYDEKPVMIFNNAENGIQTIVFFNKETGSSTIIEAFSDGSLMCIIASGDTEWAMPEKWQKTSLGGLTY